MNVSVKEEVQTHGSSDHLASGDHLLGWNTVYSWPPCWCSNSASSISHPDPRWHATHR